MARIFSPGADTWLRLFLAGGAVVIFGAFLVIGGFAQSDWRSGVGFTPAQPIPFSHEHHAGELRLDCRYCYEAVELGRFAGWPPTETCMTCHSQLFTDAPMLAPLRQSLAEGRPLAWVRVVRLPDYVYFDHSIHVTKGVACAGRLRGRARERRALCQTAGRLCSRSAPLVCHGGSLRRCRSGASILAVAYAMPLVYLAWSLVAGERAGSNPWGAAGLEWTVASPPPRDNFAEPPVVMSEAYAYRESDQG